MTSEELYTSLVANAELVVARFLDSKQELHRYGFIFYDPEGELSFEEKVQFVLTNMSMYHCVSWFRDMDNRVAFNPTLEWVSRPTGAEEWVYLLSTESSVVSGVVADTINHQDVKSILWAFAQASKNK